MAGVLCVAKDFNISKSRILRWRHLQMYVFFVNLIPQRYIIQWLKVAFFIQTKYTSMLFLPRTFSLNIKMHVGCMANKMKESRKKKKKGRKKTAYQRHWLNNFLKKAKKFSCYKSCYIVEQIYKQRIKTNKIIKVFNKS